jgi:hypothetical protein
LQRDHLEDLFPDGHLGVSAATAMTGDCGRRRYWTTRSTMSGILPQPFNPSFTSAGRHCDHV